MIPFHAPRLADKTWVDPILAAGNLCGCDYNFAVIYTWAKPYGQEIALHGDFFVERRRHSTIGHCYLWPVGKGDLSAVLTALEQDAASFDAPLRLICMTEEQAAQLEALFPGRFDINRDRNGDDYIYEINRIAELSGKKLHPKRTHVNRFMEAHPHWLCERITPSNLAECRAMEEAWQLSCHGDVAGSLQAEDVALCLALEHFSALGLDGLLLRAEGEVVAFALGDLITTDCYAVHFEKAYGSLQGAYPMITQQFARWVRDNYPAVRQLNREDDMGVEGLRQAKRSFGPDWMLEKYSAVLR